MTDSTGPKPASTDATPLPASPIAKRASQWAALRHALELAGEKRIVQSASSLTYTTVLAIVPLLAVILALFTAFPLFAEFKLALEDFLTTSLMPPSVSEVVMKYLNQFAAQASGLTAIGTLFLVVVSVMLIMTIDDVLNSIWSVVRQRPLRQRLLVYWAILSLGPILVGASLWSTAYLARESLGLVAILPPGTSLLLSLVPVVVTALGFTALFAMVPNCQVAWRDALIGGIWTALVLTIMKSGFAFYISRFPSYTVIYGAFATLPIFLLWIYLSWLGILSGATIAAILPALRYRYWEYTQRPGAPFLAALDILALLHQRQGSPQPGISLRHLGDTLEVHPEIIRQALDSLRQLGWAVPSQLNGQSGEAWVLACNAANEPFSRLVDALLLADLDTPRHQDLRQALAQALDNRHGPTLESVLIVHSGQAPLPDTPAIRQND